MQHVGCIPDGFFFLEELSEELKDVRILAGCTLERNLIYFRELSKTHLLKKINKRFNEFGDDGTEQMILTRSLRRRLGMISVGSFKFNIKSDEILRVSLLKD